VTKSLVPKCNLKILPNINIEKISYFPFVLLPPWFALQPSLPNSTFKPFENEFANINDIIIHFWNIKNLSDGCEQHFTCNLHGNLDVPFTNGFQNSLITHIHSLWNNGFINGKPLSLKCHVLCCIKTNDPIIHNMIIGI